MLSDCLSTPFATCRGLALCRAPHSADLVHCVKTLIVLQLLLQLSQLLLQLPQLVCPALEVILEIVLLIPQVCDSGLQLQYLRLHFGTSCGASKLCLSNRLEYCLAAGKAHCYQMQAQHGT